MDGGGFAVGIFEVQVVVSFLDLLDGHLPRLSVGFSAAPPFFDRQKFFMGDAAIFGVLFDTFGERELVVPDFFGGHRAACRRAKLCKENQVGVYSGVGIEYALGQADDGVDIAFFKEFFLDGGFDTLAEKRAVGKHDARAAVGL